jgi:hypothetical protein
MIRYLVGLFAALLFSLPAHAVIPASQGYWYTIAGGTGAPTLAGELNPWAAARGFVWTGCTEPWNNNTISCTFTYNGSPLSPQTVTRTPTGLVCPSNSTLSGSNCTCNSGFVELEGQCVSSTPECPVGQGKTTNRTEGWARSPNPDANDLVNDLGPPSTIYGYNDGVCVGNLTGVERCFRSQEPSPQGLYRTSCDYTMVVTGTASAAGESNSDPTEPVAACPGFVGEVNGKPVCVGTASNPLPAGTDAPNEPTSPGNPAAGPKPAAGPGSGSGGAGRTPTTGTGGNNGGPASASVGTGGTGPRSDGTEPTGEVCGASPLPPCNVKVDETGVPAEATAPGRFTQGNTDVDKVKTDADGFFNDQRDITLPSWTWTFAFPSACTALVLPAFNDFEIDVCQFQPIIHDLMSVLWVIAGIWGLIALFQRATGS